MTEAREDRSRDGSPSPPVAASVPGTLAEAKSATPRMNVRPSLHALVRVESRHGDVAYEQAEAARDRRSEQEAARKAMPFVRGRWLRMTTNVAVRTRGLAAAASA